MVRIAYFGTDGCPGHHVIPIRGKFTEEDIKVIESVDCDDFYKVFDVMRFKIAEFKGWTILGIPASLDDHRPGSKTVIFIEGKADESNFVEVIQEFPSSFIDKLTYVASKYGVTIHKIDKWYPSSKTCECGCINKGLSLRDRTWACPSCGAVNDRDILAAHNILRKGISELESKSNSSDSNVGVSCACIQESHLL